MNDSNTPLPGSTILPIECLSEPRDCVAEKLGLKPEEIVLISVKTHGTEEIKVTFYIV